MKTLIPIFTLLFIGLFLAPTALFAATKHLHSMHSRAAPVCAVDGCEKGTIRKGFFKPKMGHDASKHKNVKHRWKSNQEISKHTMRKWALITLMVGLGCLAIGLLYSLTYVLVASYMLLVMALALKRKSRDHVEVKEEKKTDKEGAENILLVLLVITLVSIMVALLALAVFIALLNALLVF